MPSLSSSNSIEIFWRSASLLVMPAVGRREAVITTRPQRLQMLFTRKVRQTVGHHKRLDVAHKGVDGGGQATNVGIYTTDD